MYNCTQKQRGADGKRRNEKKYELTWIHLATSYQRRCFVG